MVTLASRMLRCRRFSDWPELMPIFTTRASAWALELIRSTSSDKMMELPDFWTGAVVSVTVGWTEVRVGNETLPVSSASGVVVAVRFSMRRHFAEKVPECSSISAGTEPAKYTARGRAVRRRVSWNTKLTGPAILLVVVIGAAMSALLLASGESGLLPLECPEL